MPFQFRKLTFCYIIPLPVYCRSFSNTNDAGTKSCGGWRLCLWSWLECSEDRFVFCVSGQVQEDGGAGTRTAGKVCEFSIVVQMIDSGFQTQC